MHASFLHIEDQRQAILILPSLPSILICPKNALFLRSRKVLAREKEGKGKENEEEKENKEREKG